MKKRVAFLCSGLGNISRGFETSTDNWFNAIKNDKELSVKLFSGGRHKNATRVWNIRRHGKTAAILKKLNLIKNALRFEKITFSIGFLFYLFIYRPQVIWLQELVLGDRLLAYKKYLRFNYKIIFCDGAPHGYWAAQRFDYIVFLHQKPMDDALDNGVPKEKCFLIPYLVKPAGETIKKETARNQLKIAQDRFVIICVAAWNRHHKRIDYLIEEIGKFSDTKITLLLYGQPEAETQLLKEMAAQYSNLEIIWDTLSPEDLGIAYSASDLFVLPSLSEGLGMVLIEAALYGLPVICHHHDAGKFIFGDEYFGLSDLSVSGNLFQKISELRNLPNLGQLGSDTKEIVEPKFDRDQQISKLLNLIKSI